MPDHQELPPLPEPKFEGIEYELWGQNMTTNAFTPEQAREIQRQAFEAGKRAATGQQPQEGWVKQAFERECYEVDSLLVHLGLDPERCRTDGGSLNLQRIYNMLHEQRSVAAAPSQCKGECGIVRAAGAQGEKT